MKRLQYDHYGGPEAMRLADFEPPRPGPDEVLVRVRAAASNALDWKMRNGEMKLMTGRSFPRAMGHDFAGTVEAVVIKLQSPTQHVDRSPVAGTCRDHIPRRPPLVEVILHTHPSSNRRSICV